MNNNLVIIEWLDAQAQDSWDSTEDALKWADKDFIITEVGWILKETKNFIILTSQISNDDDVGNRTKIPRPWIKSRKILKVK